MKRSKSETQNETNAQAVIFSHQPKPTSLSNSSSSSFAIDSNSIEDSQRAVQTTISQINRRSTIGEKGEQITFDYLFARHRQKAKYVCTNETENGFVAKTADGEEKQLIWNKKLESANSYPYDMLYIKKDKNGKEIKRQYIEVKSTSTQEKTGILSENEWNLIRAYPTQHAVYFVSNVGSTNPTTPEKFKKVIEHEDQIVKRLKKPEYEYVVDLSKIPSSAKGGATNRFVG